MIYNDEIIKSKILRYLSYDDLINISGIVTGMTNTKDILTEIFRNKYLTLIDEKFKEDNWI